MTSSPPAAERKSKQFWAVTDQWEVKLVTGYECSEGLWWLPELGYSMSEKHHLFNSAKNARHKAIGDLQNEIDVRQAALARLRLENQ